MEWLPFELRPYPTPILRPEGAYLQRAWRQSVYPLARLQDRLTLEAAIEKELAGTKQG